MLAPRGVGVGVGVGVGDGVGAGDGAGDGDGLATGLGVIGGVGDGVPCAATSRTQTGTKTRTLRNFTRRPKGTSDRRPRDRPGRRGFRESPPRGETAGPTALQPPRAAWA